MTLIEFGQWIALVAAWGWAFCVFAGLGIGLFATNREVDPGRLLASTVLLALLFWLGGAWTL
jgi:hypothetical protein